MRKVRSEVLKALEAARNEKKINAGLEAKVLLNADLELKAKLKHYCRSCPASSSSLRSIFSTLAPANSVRNYPQPRSHDSKGRREKCDRCWNYSIHVGENSRYPTICERCSEAIAEIEGGLPNAAAPVSS